MFFGNIEFGEWLEEEILATKCNPYQIRTINLWVPVLISLKHTFFVLYVLAQLSWTFWKVIGGRIFNTDWSLETLLTCRFCLIFFPLYTYIGVWGWGYQSRSLGVFQGEVLNQCCKNIYSEIVLKYIREVKINIINPIWSGKYIELQLKKS